MNMNLYGHDGQMVMVDCGCLFNEPFNADDFVHSEIVLRAILALLASRRSVSQACVINSCS